MKNQIGCWIVACLAATAAPAMATQINLSLSGVLTSQGTESGISNTGIDANLSVGSVLTMTASFDSSQLIAWGDTGYSIIGAYTLPESGPSFFRIDGPNIYWQARDEFDDGAWPFYEADGQYELLPAIIIQGDKVVGLAGPLSPAGSSRAPYISLGSSVPYAADGNFPAPFLSDAFSIQAPEGEYGNSYNTPGFTGIWDFADSTVIDPLNVDNGQPISAVAEPATWAFLLAGFGLIGASLRRRIQVAAA